AGAAWTAIGVESDPLPVPKGTPREVAVNTYNEGVGMLLRRDYGGAQRNFEKALQLEDTLAEAHNNLAYSLRMQGTHNFDRAMRHYNRAIELKPNLAQAYMYRGVLFTQLGDFARAAADHATLLKLDAQLAARLELAISKAATGEDRGGIAGQYE
ncbi:MAG: tetratricopeptide repeat protein, partial [Burkholderiaceae bacterium]